MDSLSLADVLFSALVVAGVAAQVLDAAARRRVRRRPAAPPAARADVTRRELTPA